MYLYLLPQIVFCVENVIDMITAIELQNNYQTQ